MKTREELKSAGINLWNSRCVELIDQAEETDLLLMDKGKDTETLVGMDLAIDLLVERQQLTVLRNSHARLVEALVLQKEAIGWHCHCDACKKQ